MATTQQPRQPLTNTAALENPESVNHLGFPVPRPAEPGVNTNVSGNTNNAHFHPGGHQSARPAIASAGSSGLGQAVSIAQLHNSLRYDAKTPATAPTARELALAQHHATTANCGQCQAFLVGVARGSLHAASAPAPDAQPRRQAATQRRAAPSGPYVSETVRKRAAQAQAQRVAEQRPRTGVRTL